MLVIDVMVTGDGSDGHCYRIEALMHVIDVIAMVIDIVIRCNTCDRFDGDGDGHCFRIEAVMHVTNVMAMVMDIVIGLKL